MSGANRNRRQDKRASKKQRQGKRQISEKFEEERSTEEILPLNDKQRSYLSNLREKKVNIGVGSAGTGKTYLVSCLAADAFRKGLIEKIVVARPYVQTGRTSGMKPGSTLDKMYPYVRNMLDTIRKRIGDGAFYNALKDGVRGQIEVCEFESIRGRSFDEPTWIILDEAQQTMKDEMISFVTRCSDECHITLCGDPHQKDIKGVSGFEWFMEFTVRHNLDVGFTEFTSDDIVRGGLVKDIVKGLEKDGEF